MSGAPGFVCPCCRAAVAFADGAWRCADCTSVYPVLHGIADFRLHGDEYLSLDDERAKAARLADHAATHDLGELVDYYYSITDDVPRDARPRYARYVLEAGDRAADILTEAGPPAAGETILDIGCGSGGMVARSAAAGAAVVGVDIALRWLVIAAKRLDELGIAATLVCADAANLPFADGGFDRVFAVDLIENAQRPAAVVAAAARQLAPGGRLWLSASNRLWLGPHPSVGVWAVGWLPRRVRTALLRRLRGIDTLRHVTLLSPSGAARLCRDAGFTQIALRARGVGPRQLAGRGRTMRTAVAAYGTLRGITGLTAFAAPAFEITARRGTSA